MTYNFVPLSPESDVFSTPPTSPMPHLNVAQPASAAAVSTKQRGGRPQQLLLDPAKAGGKGGIELERTPREGLTFAHSIPDIKEQSLPKSPVVVMPVNEQALKSPCFVHSQLEKGASLVDWLKHSTANGPVSLSKSLNDAEPASHGSPSSMTLHEDDEDEQYSRSLTRQLAETAVGVREMSKALGRVRVHPDLSSILIVTKARDNRLVKLTRELAIYVMQKRKPHPSSNGNNRLIVYVDAQLEYSKRFDVEGMRKEYPEFFHPLPKRKSSNSSLRSGQSSTDLRVDQEEGQLRYWTAEMCSRSPHLFDFVVTLGGDGTVLFTSWLFQQIVPPVLPFALGSLGFLTNFDFVDHKAVMDAAIDTGIRVNLRMRFTCTVYRAVAPDQCAKKRKAVKKGATGEILMRDLEKDGWEALESGFNATSNAGHKDKEIMCFTTRPVESFEVLNDLVVDRGPSPYVSLLELFGDEHHMTTVQADGLVIATPTGSTAYSLSAGGSLVHPEIPALLISPICPHTLSFRPMLLPDTMELRICVPYNSRSTAWASFDGRGRVELKQGDHIKVTASKYPFPTVCADKQSTDWFQSISRTLKWNERERQKSFVMVEEEGTSKPRSAKRVSTPPTILEAGQAAPDEEEENDDDEEDENGDEEEEKYDIDDSANPSVNNSRPSSATPSTHASGANTPARVNSAGNGMAKVDLSMTGIPNSSSEPSSPPSGTVIARDGLAMHEEGFRDNIHSPKSLLHGAKSAIPKDRDVDSMRTPRAHDAVHPRQHPHQHHVQNAAAHHARFAPPPGFPPRIPRPAHLRARAHRPTRSADFDTSNRAFAVWGQDESDSNTDSEA
ncbi:hypothetical protein M408DRAFT_27629 [Serendipita vermifera MAFF 305830]|uniref:NAD+ kinase n=1 Tax=Serendipita vermifera MAFF 305830 TaxID=933852 RepID=A0A0C3AX33_SERVB|nr:hypothetical protein M408DRAFT_27629 [Serendipita vermifera MAFF 305830]